MLEVDKMTFPIPSNLAPQSKNMLDSYLPIRKKGNDFDWDIITGLVLSYITRKKLNQYELEEFQSDCKKTLELKLTDPQFWNTLNRMYFINHGVYKVSPLFFLFKAQFKGS